MASSRMNQPDERLVYLALKTVFMGADAQVRNAKAIRDRVQRHQTQESVRTLLQEHDLESVCNAAKALLKNKVFESTMNAKIHFPEVFEVSPAQTAERQISEAEAARTEADAIKNATEGRLNDPVSPAPDCTVGKGKRKAADMPTVPRPSALPPNRPVIQSSVSVPSLFPAYIPFPTQLQLLRKLQEILEQSCYKFAQLAVPELLQQNEWDCAESVELNIWSQVFSSNQEKLPFQGLEELGKPFSDILDSVAQLRHTAVHRIHVTMTRLLQFCLDGESLLQLMQDNIARDQVATLRRNTQQVQYDINENKQFLEARISQTMHSFAAQKAEIERLERAAIEDMFKQDRIYQESISKTLEDTMNSSTSMTRRTINADEEALYEKGNHMEDLSGHDTDVNDD